MKIMISFNTMHKMDKIPWMSNQSEQAHSSIQSIKN